MTGRRLAVGLIGGTAAALVLAVSVQWLTQAATPPIFTCSLIPTTPCHDTEESILNTRSDLMFWPDLAGKLVSVDIQPTPNRWENSPYAGYRDAEWAAKLELTDHAPFLAACYYSSDAQVTCHTDEGR
jgi:hypothetical protein